MYPAALRLPSIGPIIIMLFKDRKFVIRIGHHTAASHPITHVILRSRVAYKCTYGLHTKHTNPTCTLSCIAIVYYYIFLFIRHAHAGTRDTKIQWTNPVKLFKAIIARSDIIYTPGGAVAGERIQSARYIGLTRRTPLNPTAARVYEDRVNTRMRYHNMKIIIEQR